MTIACLKCLNRNLENYAKDNLYVDDCPVCGAYAPLIDEDFYAKYPNCVDKLGRKLEIGDTIAYAVASGRSSGTIHIGKITKMTAVSISVESPTVDMASYDRVTYARTWQPGIQKRHFNYSASKVLKLT